MPDVASTPDENTYSYLGPAGTFTEAALRQVPEAVGKPWRSVNNVGEALADVTNGRSIAAMIAIENSVEGGVSAAQDALATMPGLRIIGEYLVPVNFVLVARPGTTLAGVNIINAHPVAYAQSRGWLEHNLPNHGHIPAPRNIRDTPPAVTRFVLASRPRTLPPPTRADKTSLIVELPTDEPGALLAMLEQFSTRGVNLSLLESRPIGDALGRYRFVVDLDGHIAEERVADALLGLRRSSPHVIFLGSYPRADQQETKYHSRYNDEIFIEARQWLHSLREPST